MNRCILLLTLFAIMQSGCVSYDYEFKARAKANRETGAKLEEENNEVALIDRNGKEVRVSDFLGKNVLLVFNRGYPGYVCPYCTTYTAQIASHKENFDALNTQILVVYPTLEGDKAAIQEFIDACNDLLESAGEEALNIPVFLDPGLKLVKQFKIDGTLSKPSAFILDPKGIVRYVYVGQDRKDRPSYKLLLKEIEKISSKKQNSEPGPKNG